MITTGQVTVGTAAAGVFVTTVPPGACSFAFGNSGTVSVYLAAQFGAGTINTLTSLVIPAGLFTPTLHGYPNFPGGTIRAITASSTAVLSYIISDARGYALPQPGTP